MKNGKIQTPAPMGREERLKYEVAEELGLLDRVTQVGWGGLTAGETGRIGGLVRVRKKNMDGLK